MSSSNTKSTEWKETDEPVLCYDCNEKACAQADLGHGVHWYCFSCIMQYDSDEFDEDDSLQVCQEQLAIQSERF